MCWSGKKPYPNGASAMREARKLRRNNHGSNQLRPYLCPNCHHYHLTNDISRQKGSAYLRRYRERRALLEAE